MQALWYFLLSVLVLTANNPLSLYCINHLWPCSWENAGLDIGASRYLNVEKRLQFSILILGNIVHYLTEKSYSRTEKDSWKMGAKCLRCITGLNYSSPSGWIFSTVMDENIFYSRSVVEWCTTFCVVSRALGGFPCHQVTSVMKLNAVTRLTLRAVGMDRRQHTSSSAGTRHCLENLEHHPQK